jgi:hypothetical protein
VKSCKSFINGYAEGLDEYQAIYELSLVCCDARGELIMDSNRAY